MSVTPDWDRIVGLGSASWDVHPSLLLALFTLGAVYLVVVARGVRRGHRPRAGQLFSFTLGLLVLALILGSPLHHLSEDFLFSAHMLQHLVLTLVVPPLLLVGMPAWAIPEGRLARRVQELSERRAYPVLAFVSFNLAFAYLHLPALYDLAFGTEIAHRATHIGLLVLGVVNWLPLLSPNPAVLPRLSGPAQMLYCFAQSIPGALVGALITLSDQVLYRHYALRPIELGVNPVTDQQIGGLLMWVVGGTFWLFALTVLFFRWADREERFG